VAPSPKRFEYLRLLSLRARTRRCTIMASIHHSERRQVRMVRLPCLQHTEGNLAHAALRDRQYRTRPPRKGTWHVEMSRGASSQGRLAALGSASTVTGDTELDRDVPALDDAPHSLPGKTSSIDLRAAPPTRITTTGGIPFRRSCVSPGSVAAPSNMDEPPERAS